MPVGGATTFARPLFCLAQVTQQRVPALHFVGNLCR